MVTFLLDHSVRNLERRTDTWNCVRRLRFGFTPAQFIYDVTSI